MRTLWIDLFIAVFVAILFVGVGTWIGRRSVKKKESTHIDGTERKRTKEAETLLKTPLWTAILAVSAVSVLWLAVGFYPLESQITVGDAGAFGDSFGFVNTWFSGLAFAGVLVAIFLQIIDIRHQREELQESQEAWQQQAQSLADTAYLSAVTAIREIQPQEELSYEQSVAYEKLIKFIAELEGATTRLQFSVSSREKRAAERIEKIAADFSSIWGVIETDNRIRFKDAKDALAILRRKFVTLLPDLRFADALTPDILQELDIIVATSDPADVPMGSSRDASFAAFWANGKTLRHSLDNLASYCRARDTQKNSVEAMKAE